VSRDETAAQIDRMDAADAAPLLLACVEGREREVLELRHMQGCMTIDIAARWGVTPGRVSQIERSARERVLTKWRA